MLTIEYPHCGNMYGILKIQSRNLIIGFLQHIYYIVHIYIPVSKLAVYSDDSVPPFFLFLFVILTIYFL